MFETSTFVLRLKSRPDSAFGRGHVFFAHGRLHCCQGNLLPPVALLSSILRLVIWFFDPAEGQRLSELPPHWVHNNRNCSAKQAARHRPMIAIMTAYPFWKKFSV